MPKCDCIPHLQFQAWAGDRVSGYGRLVEHALWRCKRCGEKKLLPVAKHPRNDSEADSVASTGS